MTLRHYSRNTTVLLCYAYFGAYGIGRMEIVVVIARNEAPMTRGKYLIDNGLLRASQ